MIQPLPQSLVEAPVSRAAAARPDDLLTRAQVTARLNISRETLLRWIRMGKFPAADVVVGLWKRWKPATVEAWIAQHTRPCS